MRLGDGLYKAATASLSPFAGALIRRRVRRGREAPERMHERHARALPARPDGPLAWLHGASIGESLMLLELGKSLQARHPGLELLLTSQTRTSADLLAARLPDNAVHQMAPIDTPARARRFVGHWRPDLAVMAEGEIWPNLLKECRAAGVTTALINARMTAKSLNAWSRWPATARHVFRRFDLIIAADETTASRLGKLSGRTIAAPGNLKAALPPPPADAAQLAGLRADFVAGRTCLVAASTHPGEEALVIEAMERASPRCALILAPRHPERGSELASLCRARGFDTAQRSKGEVPGAGTAILLADTLGELGLWYQLADLVYLGGGHAGGVGGHNPLEPVRLGRPVISGPDVFNFAETMARLSREGGLHLVSAKALPERLSAALACGLAPPPDTLLRALDEEAAAPMTHTLDALGERLAERGIR